MKEDPCVEAMVAEWPKRKRSVRRTRQILKEVCSQPERSP